MEYDKPFLLSLYRKMLLIRQFEERVASPDVPAPFAPVLENAYRPDPSRIADAARKLMA